MAQQQRLLVPLDGSDVAEAALPYAEAIARLPGGALHLLTIVERESGGIFGLAPEIRDQLERGLRALLHCKRKTFTSRITRT